MARQIEKYGMLFDSSMSDLDIEFQFIRKGGTIKRSDGSVAGLGAFQHYKNCISLLWGEDDHHRWSDLALKSLVENDLTIFLGSGDSQKTYSAARFALIDWWIFPETTLWLMSSTEYRGAELRIWGTLKDLYNRAIANYPDLPGRVLEGMHAITSDKIDDDQRKARSLRRGLMFVPIKKGSSSVILSAFVGAKAPRLRHCGDEVQFCSKDFLNLYTNFFGKADFKGVMCGNPLETTDALCIAAEPVDGWDSFIDTEKTQQWRSRFYNAWVVAFDGRDSPNFDYPDDEPVKYHYLIGHKKLNGVANTHGKDSWQWFNQCVGKPKPGLVLRRVITREFCRQHGAHDVAFWRGTARTMIYGLDPAYGGGDRCVGIPVEFGDGIDGGQILKVHPHEIIPISLKSNMIAEDQIAAYVKQRLEDLQIPVENCFYDSFGRGTLGFHFNQVFGGKTPRPVDFGQKATNRPVRNDLFVEENGQRRLKTWYEHGSKFVTELWFTVREIVQSNQMRELSHELVAEGSAREYYMVSNNRVEVEPKDDMKLRVGYSPDIFDALCCACEGARQRGFTIQTIGRNIDVKTGAREDWLAKEKAEYKRDIQKFLPVYT